jgi:hypothetical protein
MRVYLFLTLFWLAVAILVFVYPLYYPDAEPYTILGTGLSAGWLLLVFAAWNGVRWWTTRSAH